MVVSKTTKGGVAYSPKKRDIIPPDFFSDLSRDVEYILADDVPVPNFIPLTQDIGTKGAGTSLGKSLGITSPMSQPSPGRNTMVGKARQRAAAYGKDDDPWGLGSNAPMTDKNPSSSSGRPALGQQLTVDSLPVGVESKSLTRDLEDEQTQVMADAPEATRQLPKTESDDRFCRSNKEKQQKAVSVDPGPSAQEDKQYSSTRLDEDLDLTLAPTQLAEARTNVTNMVMSRTSQAEDLQSTVKSNMHFEELQTNSAAQMQEDADAPSQYDTRAVSTMRSPFKYVFESGSRFTPVHADNYQEGLERLRQYLVMKYGSMREAFYRLEQGSIDVTGLGYRHDTEGAHVEGALQYTEFMHAVKYLIPNWAEVTGVGNLGKLFKSIDTRNTGFISFECLMGCKIDDEMANTMFNFCPSRPLEHCPFTAPMRHPPWNIRPNRTGNSTETFEATKRDHDHDMVMRKRAPLFTPISEMPMHHHDEARQDKRSTAGVEGGEMLDNGNSTLGNEMPSNQTAMIMHFYDEGTQTWASTTNEKQEEEDAESWISSEAHSSEQELDLHHIKLRLRAAGLSNKINWRKLFHHYDPKHMGEIDWYEFRSMIRRDVQITPDILSEDDLKRLFYSVDVVKEALGDSIFYEKFLEWLEPPPNREELAELKAEIKATVRHQRGHRFHKSPLLRNLEVERRREAANHHDHMSCNPCTKMCPTCRKIILISGWAPHKYACQRKARQVLERDHKEIAYLRKWNFKPKITAKGKRTKGTRPEDLHVAEREKDRFPIREARNRAHYDEWQEIQNKELKFQPQLNDQSRQIFRMVHQNDKEWHDRLHVGTPTHRLVGKVERKTDAVQNTKPRITVRGIQHGIERGAACIFHRLHHGPPEISTQTDPNVELEADEAAAKIAAKLEKSAKPVGIGEASWAKVKAVQAMSSLQTLAKKGTQGDSAKEIFANPSPASTGFPVGDTPSSADMFSPSPTSGTPMTLSARSAMTAMLGQARSPRPEPGSTIGGVAALSGRLRASISEKGGDSTISTALGTMMTMASPMESPAESNFSPLGRTLPPAEEGSDDGGSNEDQAEDDEEEEEEPACVVTATPKLMSLLHRCDMMRNMVVKKREDPDAKVGE